jgi:hypothetical protein
MLSLGKYSFGVGDRFAHQAKAQLRACQAMLELGVEVIPVWNKSHREHTTIGSLPESVRKAADAAVRALAWPLPYHVDADHIRLATVEGFIASSDFYTLDVADSIGAAAEPAAVRAFVDRHRDLVGRLNIEGLPQAMDISQADLERVAGKYLLAAQEAGRIYRRIVELKGAGRFITEVSMDETDSPQTPPELLIILAALADEKIPLQTIAPKFTGRFNKGVDYVGDVAQFEREFNADLAVIRFAIEKFGLPAGLKLSVHSGSDKFSIYRPIREAIARFDAGLHIKTAGTNWLEEVIGLAESGGEGLQMAKEIYASALHKREALCAPYATVIDIDRARLPGEREVAGWSSRQFVSALRHDPKNPAFNPHLRQLIHVGYKMAAQMGARYLNMLEACEPAVARNVTENLLERHLKPLFLGR